MGETEDLRAKAQIAARVSALGTTGCVIISRDGRVLTSAYDRDDLDAELIALLQLGDHQNCTILTTVSPSLTASKCIVASGKVREVVYLKPKKLDGAYYLQQNNVKIWQYLQS